MSNNQVQTIANAFGKQVQSGLVAISPKGAIQYRGIRKQFGGLALHPGEWAQLAQDLPAILEYITGNIEAIQHRIANPTESKPARPVAATSAGPSARAMLIDKLTS